MSNAKIVVAFLLTVAAVVMTQPIPPARYDGFVYKKRAATTDTVVIEAFYDPLCPFSRDSWPPLKKAVDHYGPAAVSLIVHTFPLPYHDNAFVASRALHIVNGINPSATFHLLNVFFKHQKHFYSAHTMNMSRASIVDKVIEFASSKVGYTMESAIRAGFNDSDTNLKTRGSFKYGCSRGVYGTPFFFVNGFLLQGDDMIGYDGWKKIIGPLVDKNID